MGGNRELSLVFLLSVRGGGRHAAGVEAIPEERGSWGKHGFPHGSEPRASDRHDEPFFSAHFWNAVGSITTTRERMSA
jgi:hypothetical protein